MCDVKSCLVIIMPANSKIIYDTEVVSSKHILRLKLATKSNAVIKCDKIFLYMWERRRENLKSD